MGNSPNKIEHIKRVKLDNIVETIVFVECATCSQKTGMAELCSGCYRNRRSIVILKHAYYGEMYKDQIR